MENLIRRTGRDFHSQEPLERRLDVELKGFFPSPPSTVCALIAARCNVFKRSLFVGELAAVKDLDARVMLAVKRSDRVRAARFHDIPRTVEPQAQVISLNWIRLRIEGGVWNAIRVVERIVRGRSYVWSHDESFDTESADKFASAVSAAVRT